MLIFDIGANIGMYTRIFAANTSNTLISVEASPNTYKVLKENVAQFSNVTPLEFAVSNTKDSHVTFFDCHSSVLSTLDINWLTSNESRFGDNSGNFNAIKVKAITLDKLIEVYGIPDMLKIDVEGAEEQVIKSLSKKVPILLFEWAAEWKGSLKNAVVYLTTLGFSRFHVQRGDKYDYYPLDYELSSDECIMILDMSVNKVDWGMIWAK
jgi:FkbM family methyltransferase